MPRGFRIGRVAAGVAAVAGAYVVTGRDATLIKAAVSPLAALSSSMSAGQWASMTQNGMDRAMIACTIDSAGQTIIAFCARGHWDPTNKKLRFWGQGHNDSTALISYDDATNQWTRDNDVPYAYPAGGIGHAYYHQALDPATGDVYLRGYASGVVWKRTYSTGVWSQIASFNNAYNQVAGGLEWFPGLNGGAGGLVFIDVGSAQTWNPGTNTWTVRADPLPAQLAPYHNWIALANGTMYFGGGNGSSVMHKMNSAGTVSTSVATPYAAGIWANGGAAPVISHPNGVELLQFQSGTTGDIQKFNGTSWSSIGTHAINQTDWAAFPVFDYGVVVFITLPNSAGNPTIRVFKP